MAEEKMCPPAYNIPEQVVIQKASTPKSVWVVGLYAAVVTICLVVVSVVLPLYPGRGTVCPPQQQASGVTYENNYMPSANAMRVHYEDKEGHEEDLIVDPDRRREINHYRGQGYGNDSIVVIDYDKRLMAIFDDEAKQCYLIGGVLDGPEIPDEEDIQAFLQRQSDARDSGDSVKETYRVDTEARLEDPAGLLPTELLSHCWGKPVYWAVRTDTELTARHKRSCRREAQCYWTTTGQWRCTVRINCSW